MEPFLTIHFPGRPLGFPRNQGSAVQRAWPRPDRVAPDAPLKISNRREDGAFYSTFGEPAMGKRKWKRERLADLASPEDQERVLAALDRAKGEATPEGHNKQPSESPQVER
jgi:hypothetical protein